MNEEDIIKGLKAGDEKAFKALVDSYHQRVINTCNGIVRHLADAEDLAQDVFIEVFRSVGGFRSDAHLSTWIYRIAINKSLNFVRQRKRRNLLNVLTDFFAPSGGQGQPVQAVYSPPDTLENAQHALAIHKAIEQLPENQKTAFILSKYEELPYSQIATIMGTSVSAVESLLHRAKLSLQKNLYRYYKKEFI